MHMTLTQNEIRTTYAENATRKGITMLTKTLTISCDTLACTTLPISLSVPAGDFDAPAKVRRMANEAGWRRGSDGKDACKLHVNSLVISQGRTR